MAEDRSSERVPCEKVVCVRRFYIHIYNYIYICIYIMYLIKVRVCVSSLEMVEGR